MESNKQISTFLSNFPGTVFQTFDDKGENKSLTRVSSVMTVDELMAYNKQGAGIFFSPNAFPEGQRKKNLCKGINAWFCEMDEGTIDEQLAKLESSPLQPTFVIKTRKSLHLYWLANQSTKPNQGHWDAITSGLIHHFNADRACKDISRVLRIPGFFHNKEEPLMVEILYHNENTYTDDSMLGAFPLPPNVDLFYLSKAIPSKQILESASGLPLVNGDKFTFRDRPSGGEYIDVNGSPADAWLDTDGRIGSSKDGGPTWLQWLKFYGLTNSKIKFFLNREARHLLPEKVDSETSAMDYLNDLRTASQAKSFFTWGTARLDIRFSPISRGKFILLVGETGTGKTEFSFQMASENAKKNYKVLYLSLEMPNHQLLLRNALKCTGVTQEEFRSNSYNFDLIKQHLASLPKTLKFHDQIGGFNIKELEILVTEKKYDIVFIDNLGFVDSYGQNSMDKEKNLSRSLSQICDKTNCTIVALHHFKKSDSSKQETGIRIRSVDSILGSAKTSHDVDFIVQVARDKALPENSEPIEKAELLVVQQKDRDWGNYQAHSVYFKQGKFYDDFYAPDINSKQSLHQSHTLLSSDPKNPTRTNLEALRGISGDEVSLEKAFEGLI